MLQEVTNTNLFLATEEPEVETPLVLRISRRVATCRVLGPGVRSVIWVQGCPLRCRGCLTQEALSFEGGTEIAVDELVSEIAANTSITGITLSGGEPTAQALPLTYLIRQLKRIRPELGYMSYSGFVYEELMSTGTQEQIDFLSELDILVDGPYIAERHSDLRWRGSDNQRVLFLTDKYRDWQPATSGRGVWLEFENTANSIAFAGIPPQGFLQKFRNALSRQGVQFSNQESES